MKMTIRNKLVLAISTLMVVLFSIASYLFINEKQRELSHDIYVNTLAFARLTAPTIAYNYDLYLAQNSFVYFNREMSSIFAQNDDVSAIWVISYDGHVLYNSDVDVRSKYTDEPRLVSVERLKQVQSENIALQLQDGAVVFLKTDLRGDVYFVDKDEKRLEEFDEGTLFDDFVVPANEKYSILYKLDYSNLEERVARMRMRIIYLAAFGIMLGMMMSVFMSGQVTKPVAQLVEGAERISKGDFKVRVDIRTSDELSFLGKAFNKMAQDLEASLQARLYQERKTTELQLATKIQEQLIPKIIPTVAGLDLAASIMPTGEIGGDIYDFLPLGSDRMLMYLGDVTGHGIPAGIVSSIANALIYAYSTEGDLKDVLVNVNRVMKAKTMPTMFMTLCLMEWHAVNQKFNYVNAGHEQLLHYQAATGKSKLEPAGGIALGMLPDVSNILKLNEVDLQVGDYLVVYSDGIPEAWRTQDESYGIQRLQAVLDKAAAAGASAEEAKKTILADVTSFRNGYEQMDDITIVVIKRKDI